MVLDPILNEAVLPGGHLRWTEHPTIGAAREAREETGYTVVSGNLVGVYAGRELAGEHGIVRVVYAAEIVAGSIKSSREGKAVWLPVHDYAASTARDSAIVRDWLAQSASGSAGD
jgi:ADP-ribose pyrophosphatase YjhB (NUDIX family)